LGNAIKFTPQGTVILRAKTQSSASVTTTVLTIEVIDSGIGIPTDEQAELFQPFVQLVQKKSDPEGTGLGLAISKSLIELMGGQISVNSVVGEGSTFKIELPVELAEVTDLAISENIKAVKHLAPNQPAWRLLIVDDSLENRLLLSTLLTDMGFQVREAENGQEAIQIFEDWQPALCWMDMRMPVMDGYEATAKIRQLAGGDKVKIIALTASVFIEQHQSIIEAGCDAVLHKPFHVPEIFAALSKHLGVKFIYQEPVVAPSPAVKITAEMIATLPIEMRQQLREAALQLDVEEIDIMITQIYTVAPEVAESLRELVKSFQFEQILQITETSNRISNTQ
jgi:CheY-like chemotaxis protein